MVATYEFVGRPAVGAAGLPRARVCAAVLAVDGAVEDQDRLAWRVGDRVYMHVDPAAGDPVGELRFQLQYAMATRLADCRAVALGICAELGWELFDPKKGVVVTADDGRKKPWWRFW